MRIYFQSYFLAFMERVSRRLGYTQVAQALQNTLLLYLEASSAVDSLDQDQSLRSSLLDRAINIKKTLLGCDVRSAKIIIPVAI